MVREIGEKVELALTAVRLESKAKEFSSLGMEEEASQLWLESGSKAEAAGEQYNLVRFFIEQGGQYLHPALWSISVH